jgi:hypothetical protein
MEYLKSKSRVWLAVIASLIGLLLIATLAIVILTGQAEERKPVPTEAFVHVDPMAGEPGTVISIDGGGWQPGETVVVYLVEPGTYTTDGVVYASAVADKNGQILASFRYPTTGPWATKPGAYVSARGITSGRRVRVAFEVIQPTSTPTVTPEPATVTPTVTPTTVPPTATPTAVPPTATPTAVPPTATPTAVPPTATPTAVPPTATPTHPAPTATPVVITDWRGEYYGNVDLIGSPRVRNDTNIDFDWGSGKPIAGVAADGFSVRWTRRLDFKAGTYRFYVKVDDGARLWIDGQLVIDQWHDSSVQTYSADRNLTRGKHDIRLEMYDRSGLATIALWWEKAPSYPDWKGQYFNNIYLSGSPVLVRNDKGIDFNWGAGAPGSGLPADNFSVRWTHTVYYPAGTYRFYVQVDDGARLWVDGQLVIDQWHDGSNTYNGDVYLTEGNHEVRLEMYEHLGGAMARMWWEQLKGFPEWKGQYYSNRKLKGDPVMVRNDVNLSFDWGTGAPASILPADNFSVRWTRKVEFTAGLYRFCAKADDGVSVQIDDQAPVISEWHDGIGTYCQDVYVTGGTHKLRVEYYEHVGAAMLQFGWEKLKEGVVPSGAIRPLDLHLYALAPAYAVLDSEAAYKAFVQKQGLQTAGRYGGDTSPVDWQHELVVAAFLGEKPTAGTEVSIDRITYKGTNIVVYLKVSGASANGNADQVVTSPYTIVAVQRSALAKGLLTYTFVDQAGTVYAQGTVAR